MVDPVERLRQVRVQYPPPVRVSTFGDLVDRCDRVLTATAGTKSVRSRLEPRLPLWFQCIDDPGLFHPFASHRNSERALLPACFRDKHSPDGKGMPRFGTMNPFDQFSLG